MDYDKISAEDIVLNNTPLPASWKVTDELWLPPDECQRFQGVVDAFKAYQEEVAKRKKEKKDLKKPLSIAVFGSPGSGKSHAVKQLAAKAGLLHIKYNLSQLSEIQQLTAAFRRVSDAVEWSETPLIFFDEFDSDLSGQPLGWLRWFLAPMEDGEFTDNGVVRKFGNCIFVFGGGTSPRYSEFQRRHADHFIEAKGPDFISRLSDYIDIRDPNDAPWHIRRAMLIKKFLRTRLNLEAAAPITIPEERKERLKRLEALLEVGRYRHGVRSLQTVINMIDPNTWEFQDKEQLGLHVDGGPLEGRVIAFSAGGPASEGADLHKKVAETLLQDGARLIYGGNPFYKVSREEKSWVTKYVTQLDQVLARRPPDLLEEQGERTSRVRNLLATVLPHPTENLRGVEYVTLTTLTEEDMSRLGLKGSPQELQRPAEASPADWARTRCAWALSLFRMRVRLMQEADAVVVMTGKDFGADGRFPGIAEEVMLALAFKKPVYIVGGFGGAAEAVGSVLGLSEGWKGIPACLTSQGHIDHARAQNEPDYEEFLKQLEDGKDDFTLPFLPGLPHTYQELCTFLGERAPGREDWPDNGLTRDENQELFRIKPPKIDSKKLELIQAKKTVESDSEKRDRLQKSIDEINSLIQKGLRVRFGR